MNLWMRFIVLLFLLLSISACSSIDTVGISGEPSVAASPYPTPLPEPETGKASVTGQIVEKTTSEPLAETIIRLAEVYREDGEESEGAYVLDVAFSPGDISDDVGYFFIENITPGEYVIVIGNPFGAHDIIENADGTAKVWDIAVDQVTDLGVIKANP